MTQPPDGTPPPDGDRQPQDPTGPFPAPERSGPEQSVPSDQPSAGHPPDPTYRPVYEGAPTPGSGPARPAGSSPRRRVLVIAAIVLPAVLVLSAGAVGAWLLLRDTDRNGAPDPTVAVEEFLEAVYSEHDPARASALVCSEARDEQALRAKIDGIQGYDDTYAGPDFTWDEPEVVDESGRIATVSVTVTMVTDDEKTADQPLEMAVLDKAEHGWWVCNVDSVTPDEGTPAEREDGGSGEPDPSGSPTATGEEQQPGGE